MDHIFFWRETEVPYGKFSNWYINKNAVGKTIKFYVPSLNMMFNCSEQGIMYGKALLFGDMDIAKLIIDSESPKEQKALGRKVKNFDENIWKKNVGKIGYNVIFAKFTSDTELKNLLLSTGDAKIAEASPLDKIWGIGIGVKDAERGVKFKGKNLLGTILMKVRDDLQA
jgi:ribA/ribD-fused uncharacterized protein